MSKRNLAWMVIVIGALVLVGVTAGWMWGIIAAAATLVASETYERDRRRRRRAARGDGAASPVRDAFTRRGR
jgi:hypothetical protein